MLQRMAKRIRLPSALRALARKLTITINRFTGKETEKRQPARACFHFSGDWAKRVGPHGPLSSRPISRLNDSYLVDPASSHMLVSKIKPCMSKYKQLYTVKLQMAH